MTLIENIIKDSFDHKSYFRYLGKTPCDNNVNILFRKVNILHGIYRPMVKSSIIHNYKQYNLNLRRSNK